MKKDFFKSSSVCPKFWTLTHLNQRQMGKLFEAETILFPRLSQVLALKYPPRGHGRHPHPVADEENDVACFAGGGGPELGLLHFSELVGRLSVPKLPFWKKKLTCLYQKYRSSEIKGHVSRLG